LELLDQLGGIYPECFPTIEEYEEGNRTCTEPVYGSADEIMALEQADDPSVHEAYRTSWLARACSA
jgi:hypothetical protein